MLGIVVVLAAAFIIFLTVTEFRPDEAEPVAVSSYGEAVEPEDSISLMTWNIGYCGLGANEDFVMDGGTGSGKPERSDFDTYYSGAADILSSAGADIYFIQEVDSDSARSYRVDEVSGISAALSAASSAYAINYSCPFVPFPWPPMGRVNSGLLTLSDFASPARRSALPSPAPSPGP